MSSFDSFKLDPSILSKIAERGYKEPTPIQELAFEAILNKQDLLGIAQTGTGKTAAFALPILTNLNSNKIDVKPGHVRCLILTPTRELADQIEKNIEFYSSGLDITSKIIIGGVSKRLQIEAIQSGIDILVATPGRLLDIVREGHIQFDQLETLVLDEADAMLDLGFFHDVKWIISFIKVKKQTLLFSATMPEEISSLVKKLLVNPIKVQASVESTTVDDIDQKLYLLKKINKPAALMHILENDDVRSMLIFSKTKMGADQISEFLKHESVVVDVIHSDRSQGTRDKAIKAFREGEIKVLVATDIAARGIDIDKVSHVINWNLPEDPRNYVHRVGRTARAGSKGKAITFTVENDIAVIKAIEEIIKQKIEIDVNHPFHVGFPMVVKLSKKELLIRTKERKKKNNKKK
jgi:ATP-dependent RNA helicase RhlE